MSASPVDGDGEEDLSPLAEPGLWDAYADNRTIET